MTLRIGAILLASANLLTASVINAEHSHIVHGVAVHEHSEPLPAKGIIVKDYTIGKECDSHEPGHHEKVQHESKHHSEHHS